MRSGVGLGVVEGARFLSLEVIRNSSTMTEVRSQFRLELPRNYGVATATTLYFGQMVQEGESGPARRTVQIINVFVLMFTTAAACRFGVAVSIAYLLFAYPVKMGLYIFTGRMESAETLLRQNVEVFTFIFTESLNISFSVAYFAHFLVNLPLHACGVLNLQQQDEEPEAEDIVNEEIIADVANAEVIARVANAETETIANVEATDDTEDFLAEVGDATDCVDTGDVVTGELRAEEASENFRDAFVRDDLPIPRISQSLLPEVPQLVRRFRRHNSSKF